MDQPKQEKTFDFQKQNEIKRLLGEKAAECVQEGMLIGLGTGSTAAYFISSLILRCKHGLHIRAVSSSERSLEQAKEGNIPLANLEEMTEIDLTIDGADEVDPYWRMIKGKGGALVREKILASSSKKMIIIIDESKLVAQLGKSHLPVEILPFAINSTLNRLSKAGYKGKLRQNQNKLYISDNGNYIFDIESPHQFSDPEKDHQKIINIPGVVDTGFFFDLATNVLVGYGDGRIEWLKKK